MTDPNPTEATSAIVAIQQLVAHIANLADDGDIDEYVAQFTPDATWQMPANEAVGMSAQTVRGHAAIRAGAIARREAAIQGPGTRTRHVVTNTHVDVRGETASAVSYFRFYTSTVEGPRLTTMGTYTDLFARTAGRWSLSHRVITLG